MTHEPEFDELVGPEATGAERERLRGVHELLLQAGAPPELPPRLRKAPDFRVVPIRRRVVKKRPTLLLLAAALSVLAVFAAGYAVADQRGGGSKSVSPSPRTLSLTGTSLVPHARATLEVWRPQGGNWPMTLSVAGLPRLPQHAYYEVYLVRDNKPWGSCGMFRVTGPSRTTLTLNAPYSLRKGDSWVVTRTGPGGGEPGRTVLRPVPA